MPSISTSANLPWSNYHLTVGKPVDPDRPCPVMWLQEAAYVHSEDVANLSGPTRFAATAAALQTYLAGVWKRVTAGDFGSNPPALGPVGKAWSFAPLVGTDKLQLFAEGLGGMSMMREQDFHADCKYEKKHIALVGGGLRLREIANWGARRGLMISNSGTHLGPTIAGAFATASHGSKLGYGGLQDMVIGMHIVTGPESSVWLERKTGPLLNDDAITAMNAKLIRSDLAFEDALIHLGGLGIVNGVAIELEQRMLYSEMRRDHPIDDKWLNIVSSGDLKGLSDWLLKEPNDDFDGKPPAFYEVTIKPSNWKGPSALHIAYFEVEDGGPSAELEQGGLRANDAIAAFLEELSRSGMLQLWLTHMSRSLKANEDPPIETDIYELYRKRGGFSPESTPLKNKAVDWRSLHMDEITGGLPGSLYNASFAIPRSELSKALAGICAATENFPPTFLFTVRFVTNPKGTLAFTRFPENAVIEIDGASPLYWKLQAAKVKDPKLKKKILQYAQVLEKGAMTIRRVLKKKKIDYSMHWGKLGKLNSTKVHNDFGPLKKANSKVARWRKTRKRLLGKQGMAVFWNEALVDYGLVDRPTISQASQDTHNASKRRQKFKA